MNNELKETIEDFVMSLESQLIILLCIYFTRRIKRYYLQEVECNAELQRLHAIRSAEFEWHGIIELDARTEHSLEHDTHAHTGPVLLDQGLNVIFQALLAVDGDQTAHVTEHVTA